MRSEERRQFIFVYILWLLISGSANATPFSFDDIKYWVGSGTNRAAIAIDWTDTSTQPPALVWGYRWDGVKHGSDMLTAIVADDSRLFAKLGGTPTNRAVYGLGYDANNNGQFGIDDDTQFDSQGFALTDPSDGAVATDSGDYYSEGWFGGFWHYGVATVDPYNGGSWSDTIVGASSRTLVDGAWDSWTFSPTFNFTSFAVNPVAADPPYPPGDFDHDGHVTAADYAVWRSNFGSTSELAADASGNSVVDAADYVIWRRNFSAAGSGSALLSNNVPEPAAVWLIAILLVTVLVQRNR